MVHSRFQGQLAYDTYFHLVALAQLDTGAMLAPAIMPPRVWLLGELALCLLRCV